MAPQNRGPVVLNATHLTDGATIEEYFFFPNSELVDITAITAYFNDRGWETNICDCPSVSDWTTANPSKHLNLSVPQNIIDAGHAILARRATATCDKSLSSAAKPNQESSATTPANDEGKSLSHRSSQLKSSQSLLNTSKNSKSCPPLPEAGPVMPKKPKTSYEVFFQLERQYILQVIHSVIPNLKPDNIFDPSDYNYHGPPLPERYNKLVLPKRFYSSYKDHEHTERRKHRATHGKVEFITLSKMIASQWKIADDEVKNYCHHMRVLDSEEFKRRNKEYLKLQQSYERRQNEKVKPPVTTTSESTTSKKRAPPQHHILTAGSTKSPHVNSQAESHLSRGRLVATVSPSSQTKFEGTTGDRAVPPMVPLSSVEAPKPPSQITNPPQQPQIYRDQNHNGMEHTTGHQDRNFPHINNTIDKYVSTHRLSGGAPQPTILEPDIPSDRVLLNCTKVLRHKIPSRFNIFCQLEKAYIIQEELGLYRPAPGSLQFDPQSEGFGKLLLPPRYRKLHIPPRFYDMYDDDELILMMRFQLDLPNCIKCAFDISECLGRRWRNEADDQIKAFCEIVQLILEKNSNDDQVVPLLAVSRGGRDIHTNYICSSGVNDNRRREELHHPQNSRHLYRDFQNQRSYAQDLHHCTRSLVEAPSRKEEVHPFKRCRLNPEDELNKEASSNSSTRLVSSDSVIQEDYRSSPSRDDILERGMYRRRTPPDQVIGESDMDRKIVTKGPISSYISSRLLDRNINRSARIDGHDLEILGALADRESVHLMNVIYDLSGPKKLQESGYVTPRV